MIEDETHKKFQEILRKSAECVWFIARWLWGQGFDVWISKLRVAPERSDWRKYSDSGDLHILLEGVWKRVEVKKLGVNFTNASDWPFPDFMVCSKHSYDNAVEKPAWYLIVSADQKALGIVVTKNAGSWGVVDRNDSRFDEVQSFYTCSPESVLWRSLI